MKLATVRRWLDRFMESPWSGVLVLAALSIALSAIGGPGCRCTLVISP